MGCCGLFRLVYVGCCVLLRLVVDVGLLCVVEVSC